MSEKPIIFSTPMVKALLAGRKTQTRRLIKRAWDRLGKEWAGAVYPARESGFIAWWPDSPGLAEFTLRAYQHGFKLKYAVGDVLWVRETWAQGDVTVLYKADFAPEFKPYFSWRPSIYLRRTAARIFLRVTSVRVDRVQNISDAVPRVVGSH
jgi:hypothetical protein